MKVKTLVPLLCVLATASVWPLAHAADAAKAMGVLERA